MGLFGYIYLHLSFDLFWWDQCRHTQTSLPDPPGWKERTKHWRTGFTLTLGEFFPRKLSNMGKHIFPSPKNNGEQKSPRSRWWKFQKSHLLTSPKTVGGHVTSRFAIDFGSREFSPSKKGHKLAELPGKDFYSLWSTKKSQGLWDNLIWRLPSLIRRCDGKSQKRRCFLKWFAYP